MSKENHLTFNRLCDEIFDVLQDKRYSKQHYPPHDDFKSVIKLAPTNPKASGFELAELNDQYFRLFTGRSTAIEFSVKKEGVDRLLESVKGVSRAIVEGKFTETVWLSGDKVTRYHSEFKLKDRIIKCRDCNLPAYLFLRSTKHVYTYEEW